MKIVSENGLLSFRLSKNVRILWLAHRDPLNPRAGGAERTIYEVSTRLAGKGNKIILLTGGWRNCKSNENLQGIEIHRFGKNIGPHLALPVFLIKGNFDIVVNDLGHAVPWFSSTILNSNNIVFFHHLHARSLPGQVHPLLAKLITALERCYFIIYHNAVFVTESSTSRNDLLKLGIKGNRIFMNPPGVDTMTFHPSDKTNHPSFVYFGGMRKYKRPQEALFLLKRMLGKMRDLRMTIIGTGPEEQHMRRLADDLHIQDHVEFKGRVSTEELASIVASSWVNIHTSLTEGWGLSILEASAAGTPTVAYDVPGVRDAIEDGLNGIKVEDGNREALADAALTILNDPERWWSSSLEVAKKYSRDKTAELWDMLIKQAAAAQKNF